MNRGRLVGKPRRSDRVMPDELGPEGLAANLGLRRLRDRIRSGWEDLVADLDRLSRRDRGCRAGPRASSRSAWLTHGGVAAVWLLRRRASAAAVAPRGGRGAAGSGRAQRSGGTSTIKFRLGPAGWCLPRAGPAPPVPTAGRDPRAARGPAGIGLVDGTWSIGPSASRFCSTRLQGKSRSPTAVFRSRIALRWRIKASRYARTYSL